MAQRPPDIVSPITNQILAQKVAATEAQRAGRSVYDKPTADNVIMLFIDHQIGLMAGMRDFASLAEYRSNVVGLARTARALKCPVLLSSSNAQWQNGDTLPELKEIFVEEPIRKVLQAQLGPAPCQHLHPEEQRHADVRGRPAGRFAHRGDVRDPDMEKVVEQEQRDHKRERQLPDEWRMWHVAKLGRTAPAVVRMPEAVLVTRTALS
jgi:hypothetical protein